MSGRQVKEDRQDRKDIPLRFGYSIDSRNPESDEISDTVQMVSDQISKKWSELAGNGDLCLNCQIWLEDHIFRRHRGIKAS
jgi:hypothetical protein